MKAAFAILATLFVLGCTEQPKYDHCTPEPGLPCAEHMETQGRVTTPPAATEFCERNPEFEQC
jgi:hypothetical protein